MNDKVADRSEPAMLWMGRPLVLGEFTEAELLAIVRQMAADARGSYENSRHLSELWRLRVERQRG